MSPSIARRDGSLSASPPYSARAQCDEVGRGRGDRAGPCRPPSRPTGTATIEEVPVRSIGGSFSAGAGEPVGVGRRHGRLSGRLGRPSPAQPRAGSSEAVIGSCSPMGAPPTASASIPRTQVVRVRVVVSAARLEIGLADVPKRILRGPTSLPGVSPAGRHRSWGGRRSHSGRSCDREADGS